MLREPIGQAQRPKVAATRGARGVALELKQVSVLRGHSTARVTICFRALLLADSIWYVN
jgi:hypothetical protein